MASWIQLFGAEMFDTKAQADAVRKLDRELEARGEHPVSLNLDKSFAELTTEQKLHLLLLRSGRTYDELDSGEKERLWAVMEKATNRSKENA